ncbi:adhesion G-protein coupled receptor G2-like [Lissotriton helveticus]
MTNSGGTRFCDGIPRRCFRRFRISPMFTLLFFILVVPQQAWAGFLGEYKAVFESPCNETVTLNKSLPSLPDFLVCVYLNLPSVVNPWTVFTYRIPPSYSYPEEGYELGLAGDSGSLILWIFGNQIVIPEKLNPDTWYYTCIQWEHSTFNMTFFMNGVPVHWKQLKRRSSLFGGGNLSLGCSQMAGMNTSGSVGFIGSLYMFRMWDYAQTNVSLGCSEGNVINWATEDWIYGESPFQIDTSLQCANMKSLTTPALAKGTANTKSLTTPALAKGTAINSSPLFERKVTVKSDRVARDVAGTKLTTNHGRTCPASVARISGNLLPPRGPEFPPPGPATIRMISATADFTTIGENNTIDGIAAPTSGKPTYSHPTVKNSPHDSTASLFTKLDVGNFTVTFKNITIDINTVPTFDNTSNAENTTCTFNFTEGVNDTALPDNVCDMSQICNNSIFYKINLTITSDEDSMETANSINYIFANLSLSGLTSETSVYYYGAVINITNSSLSDLSNQTLSAFSCNPKNNGSVKYCEGIVKLQKGQNICTVMGQIRKTYEFRSLEIHQIDYCCCMAEKYCPSLIGDLKALNCYEKQTIVTCAPGNSSNSGSNSNSGSKPTSGSNTNSVSSTSSGSSLGNPISSITTKATSYDVTRSKSTIRITSTAENAEENLDDLNDLLNSTNLNASIVDQVVSRMESIVAGNIQPKMAGMLVGVVSNFLNVAPVLLAPVSQRIITVVDTVGLKLNFSSQSVNFTSPSLVLAVTKINASSFSETSFSVQNSGTLQANLDTQTPINSSGSITLPASLLDNLGAQSKDWASRIQFNFFEKASLFQDPSLQNKSLVSYIISAAVSNLTISNLASDVTITLRTSIPPSEANFTKKCVFWDFNRNNGTGGWSSEGCAVAGSKGNETVCKCNHLTSFGVLLDFSRNSTYSPLQVLILTFITYIGCGLSAIFLAITLVTYIAFEKIRRDYPSQILIQLCAALLCLNLTFLLDSWIALYNNVPGLCISVAVFLHYFLLVTFTWMALEAFHMYLALVKVFNTYVRKYILKFCIVGWGLPAIVVAIVVAISRENYGLASYGKYPNGATDQFCWINSDVAFYITVVGYFCLMFLLNVGMFIVVLIQLCRIKKKKQLGNQRRATFQDLRSVAGLTFLLGITWGFAFFAWGPVNLPFMYLFCIFNTLQGFFIFIFYCVAKENVRKQWRRYLCCGRFRLAENSDWSKTATNFLKKQAINQGVSSSSNNSLQSNSNGNSTNSATLLVNNEYSMQPSSNGNVSKERNGVAFNLQNGDVSLQALTALQDAHSATKATQRRTSNRASTNDIDQ